MQVAIANCIAVECTRVVVWHRCLALTAKRLSIDFTHLFDCKKDVSEANRRTRYVEIVTGVQFISVWWVLTMP